MKSATQVVIYFACRNHNCADHDLFGPWSKEGPTKSIKNWHIWQRFLNADICVYTWHLNKGDIPYCLGLLCLHLFCLHLLHCCSGIFFTSSLYCYSGISTQIEIQLHLYSSACLFIFHISNLLQKSNKSQQFKHLTFSNNIDKKKTLRLTNLQFGLVHHFTKLGSGEYYLEELEHEVIVGTG